MTTLRAKVNLPNVNGLPADVITNNWHCQSNSVDPVDDAELFATALQTFYTAIDVYLASTIDTTGTIDFYDLEDVSPRVPIYTEPTLAITPGANAPLPHEVAMVLSFNGLFTSGSPAGRRRGRIFLGPLDSAVMDDTLGQAVIQNSVISAVRTAAEALMDAGDAANFQWAVFSPTTAGAPPWSTGEILAATLPVVAGFVDNSFDTIRSRGIQATERLVFPS